MQRHFILILVILVAVWVGVPVATWTSAAPSGFWPLRRELVLGSGFLAISCMSLAMILAARPARLERWLGGLDQFYRLHKRLGIAATLFALAHWGIEIVPKWMARQGMIAPPQRRGAPGGADAAQGLLSPLRDAAAGIGEWALYAVIVLVVVALWKRIPYRHFAKLHRFLAPAYLLLVFHAVVLIPVEWWTEPVGLTAGATMIGGSFAALLSLAGRIGFRRRALGRVVALELHDDRVLEVHCRLETPWAGHASGQFVFVTFDPREGAHPFTVVSSWTGDGHVALAIKGLGDYTRALPKLLRLGDPVTIEGPYGVFDFAGDGARQIWIAGGIGVTPFISRMQWLAEHGPERRPVDFFFSTNDPDEGLFAYLRDLAVRAGVALHLVVTPRDPMLTVERVGETVPGYREADVWFCGPKRFGDAMRAGFRRAGAGRERFHQEAFEMR